VVIVHLTNPFNFSELNPLGMTAENPNWSESLVDLYRGLRARSVDQTRLPDFIRETRAKIAHFIEIGDLRHAAIYEKILKDLVPLSYCVDYVSEGVVKRNEILSCLSRLRRELSSFESVLSRDLYAHDERVSEALRNVEHQRTEELRAFDLETERGLPRAQTKVSGRILEMRKVERSLIVERRFQEATALRRDRMRLERSEKAMLGRKFLGSREQERRQLEAILDRKSEVAKDCGLNSRELIESEGQRCLEALRQRIRHLEAKAAAFQDRVLESESVLRHTPISNPARIRAKQSMKRSKRVVKRSPT
jgi:hypothetical protein